MSSHSPHEKSEKHQGGATNPRVLNSPLKIRPPTSREDETDGPDTSKGLQVQLWQQMRGNLQAVEGFPNISISHTKVETQPTHLDLPSDLGGSSQRCISVGSRGWGTTNIHRQSDALRGREEIPDDRECGAGLDPHGEADAPLFPKPLNHCKDKLPNL